MSAMNEKTGYYLAIPAVVFVVLFCLYPTATVIFDSLFKFPSLGVRGEFVGLTNFASVITGAHFQNALKYSSLIILNDFVIQLPLALIIAFLIMRKPKLSLYMPILCLSFILPLVICASIWKWMFNSYFGIVPLLFRSIGIGSLGVNWLGTLDLSFLGCLLVANWIYVPYFILIFTAALKSVPRATMDAGKLDGLSELNILWRICLPLMKPILIVVIAFSIAGAFKSFDLIWVLTGGGPARSSEILGIYLYKEAFLRFRIAYAFTTGCLIFFICTAIAILERKIVRY